ncbi:hypothetical protein [Streptomyces sp. NPDC048191]|uniref:hypothetical protein n=1 Tax=Streptomyces sp. NPDC048191 TaxID=3155484 RepID=UPI0033C71CCA
MGSVTPTYSPPCATVRSTSCTASARGGAGHVVRQRGLQQEAYVGAEPVVLAPTVPVGPLSPKSSSKSL